MNLTGPPTSMVADAGRAAGRGGLAERMEQMHATRRLMTFGESIAKSIAPDSKVAGPIGAALGIAISSLLTPRGPRPT